MGRKLAAATSLHALDITNYSSPIHSLDSPLSALSKSLSSKYLFSRRSRSTLNLSSTTSASNVATPLSNVFTLTSCTESAPKCTDSLSNLAAATSNQPEWENALQPSITAASVLPTTDSTFSISSPVIKPSNKFRASRVSLITSTFRKFRARRADVSYVDGGMVANEGDVANVNADRTVAIPSLPPSPTFSPFSQPVQREVLSTTQSMSTISHLAAPGHALRSTYSDSAMHLHSERDPVAQFTRHQGGSRTTLAEAVVVYPRSAKSLSPTKRPTKTIQERGGEGGLGIVGMLYCAKKGKYSVIGGLLMGDIVASEEFATMVGLDKEGMEDVKSEEDDEGVMIDAGVVILRESKVKPTPSTKKMMRRVPPPQVGELAMPKDTLQSPLTTGPHLIVASHPMSREKHTASTTETEVSLGSGTEAGASRRSGSETHSASASDGSHTGVDGLGYQHITGILGISFPESEDGNAFNQPSPGTSLPEGSFLAPIASASNDQAPPSGSRAASALLQSPFLLALGHPASRFEQPQESRTPSSLSSGKRSQSLKGLFTRSTPGSCSPSASSTGSASGMKKSATGLGKVWKEGAKGARGVLLDYAQVAHLMELKDEE